MLRNVFNFEVSSGGLSEAYAVSIDAVLASLAEVVDGVVEGAGDGVAIVIAAFVARVIITVVADRQRCQVECGRGILQVVIQL